MIPTYNGHRFLPRTLESVLRSAVPDMQIEVVDDRSTEGDPIAIAADLAPGLVSVHRQARNVGHTRNFNTCLKRARGHLVHLLHDDDLVEPGFYRRMEELLEEFPDAGSAICRHSVIDDDGVHRALGPLLQADVGPIPDWLSKLSVRQVVQPPTVVVRRSVYEAVGGFDESIRRYGEDWEMYVRIAGAAPVVYTPEPLAAYRRRATGSLSDASHIHTNMADMRHIIRSNAAVLARAGVAEPYESVPRARADLGAWLLQQAVGHVRDGRPRIAARTAYEAFLLDHRPATVAAAISEARRGFLAWLGRRETRWATATQNFARRIEHAARVLRAPETVPEGCPSGILHALGDARLVPIPQTAPDRRAWSAGPCTLHEYLGDTSRIARSIRERDEIARSGFNGLPSVRSHVLGPSSAWVLEDRTDGAELATPNNEDRGAEVLELLVELAGPPGRRLGDTEFWNTYQPHLLGIAAPSPIAVAWELIAEMPARRMHGDANVGNVRLTGIGPRLIGWDGAWSEGMPGVDLLTFAAFSASAAPDEEALREMVAVAATGRHPCPHLERLGVSPRDVPTLVVGALVYWAGRERERLRSVVGEGPRTPCIAALEVLGPQIASVS